jgi:2-octaprenyl-6-methoxyphenol hydroxylase
VDKDFDILIIGGGMAGASLAIALKNTSLKIGLVEAYPLKTDSQPSYDDRGIALSYGSQRIFETMAVWPDIASKATAIKDIHISDRGQYGVTRLSAVQQGVPALGQVLTARDLGHTLNQHLQMCPELSLFCPAKVTALTTTPDDATITLDDEQTLNAKLIVAADGKYSTIRQLLGLGAWEQGYNQTAITANISTDKPHHGCAYERFTETGPMALLPLSENRSSLVWTVNSGEQQGLLDLDDKDFLNTLQQRFGYRAGRFIKVGQRNCHPLTLMQADSPQQQRVLLIGNASHSLHPIAGQGFNLGLRDVAVLAELLVQYAEDCGQPKLLFDYQAWRGHDQDQIVAATDSLVTLFSNHLSPLTHLRGAGLAILDTLPAAKNVLANHSMGLGFKQPKLARGLTL